MVAEVASIADYYDTLHAKLNQCGFVETSDAEHMCRWRKGSLLLDVMPSTGVLGHSVNRWYAEAIKSATVIKLPSGNEIKLVSPPLFLATKLDSFVDRGGRDYMHHDMEDILNIVDGRETLHAEIKAGSSEVGAYISDEMDGYLADETFVDQLQWIFPFGRSEIVLARLRAIAGT